ncbi:MULTISPECIES: hypothetical protein [Burkholderiaceae]|uniref:Uncharacterized protein n=1 Tax=Paraburkholderia aromaticivorans TaxID=2026199 RepID=A0A248VZB6_9BURK|nr:MULTISPECIES: hypothetical protein [Burkholderiaceae]EIF28077.1 hypothetical protein BCh11DRAFT_07973 [Burkholderia sp. Ch1-1]HDR9770718.1 hypothetical protein [Burkholderia cepacia ATCC 25416]ASW04358.1 hypothetical protein CJU94_40170 [Paraburkholderia aromaticivorans]MCA8081665.1 hypothetical protein [Burkholderia cepacia]HDR9777979.1 hypothetical protein [Burkholderia cepacia ATCC 25416]
MKTVARTGVAILALLVGLLFCFAAARGYMQHNTIALRPLLFGLVDVVVACVLLRKAYTARKARSMTL